MLYLLLNIVAGAWVFLDARSRRDSAVAFSLGTVLLGPLVAPIYLARRPLREGESREGGTGWRVCANLTLAWTITMLVMGIAGMAGAAKVVEGATSDAEKVGAAVGAGLGVILLFAMWIVPVIVILVLGLVLRKSGVVEKGPSRALALVSPAPAAPWYTKGLLWSALFLVVAIVGMYKPKVGNESRSAATVPDAAQAAPDLAASPVVAVSGPITATALVSDYEENEVAADARHKGKAYLVRGDVGSISKGFGNEIYVTLKCTEIRTVDQYGRVRMKPSIRSVQCFLAPSETAKAGTLSAGQFVTVQGTVSGLMMNVVLRNCTIVTEAPVESPAPANPAKAAAPVATVVAPVPEAPATPVKAVAKPEVTTAAAQPKPSAATPAEVQKAAEETAQKEADDARTAARVAAKALMTKLEGEGLKSSDLARAQAIVALLERGELENPADAIPDTSILSIYRRHFMPVRDAFRHVAATQSRTDAAIRQAHQQRMKDDPDYRAQVEAAAKVEQERIALEQERIAKEQADQKRAEEDRRAKAIAARAAALEAGRKAEREREAKRLAEEQRRAEENAKWDGTEVTQDDAKLSPFFACVRELIQPDQPGQDKEAIRKQHHGKTTTLFLAWENAPRSQFNNTQINDVDAGLFALRDMIDRNAAVGPGDGPYKILYRFYGTSEISDAMILRSDELVRHPLGSTTLDVARIKLRGPLEFAKTQNDAVARALAAANKIKAERKDKPSLCVFKLTATMTFNQGSLKVGEVTLDGMKVYAFPEMSLLYPLEAPAAATPTGEAPTP